MEATMKVLSCALAMVVCLAAPTFAQTPGAAYVEFGGNGFFYSVNGELAVAPNLTMRVGGLFLPGVAAVTASVNRLFGRGSNYLVLGAGWTFGGGGDIGLNAATTTIGYRYMRRDAIFFQAAATPFFTDGRVYPWAGLSIGKAY
jgi:hypothetical protein